MLGPTASSPTTAMSAAETGGPRAASADQLYGGAECWVWILVAAILGVVVGYLSALLCMYWNRHRPKKEDKGTTSGGPRDRDPLRDLPAHVSDTMVSTIELGHSQSQPMYFPGQSLRSETRPDPPPPFPQPSESVLIPGGTLHDDVEEQKQQQLARDKVGHDLAQGMTLEGTSYQYFHPEAQKGDDDSPRVSFTFS